MKPKLFTFPFFIILMSISVVAISDVNLEIPTVQEDVTIADEYHGRINSTHPLYWGNYSYFLGQNLTGVFFVQKGGVHNHAYYHTNWNEKVYITKITNAEYVEWTNTTGQVLYHQGETHIFYSDNSDRWSQNRVCPLCNHTMHAYEFSAYSTALYWYCDYCRVTIGEVLGVKK